MSPIPIESARALFAALGLAAAFASACAGGNGSGARAPRLLPPPAPVLPVPSPRQLAWQRRELIAFVHFGMNTFTDREWGEGQEDPKLFQPSALDARQWARVLKEGGFKMVILTAKHHDGFCLWPSALTDHSVKSSPWRDGRGDVVGELAAAARAEGLDLGLYLSPWDRHEKTYGDSFTYNRYYLAQLRELLTKYGPVHEVWMDGANGEGPNGRRQVYDFDGFRALVRKLQPQAVIFSDAGPDVRWVGNERGRAGDPNWSMLDRLRMVIGQKNEGQTSGHEDGPDWVPAEADVSIRPGWFYHAAEDAKVKTVAELVDIYDHSVGLNGLLLLNVPPDRRGLIHEVDAERLRAFRRVIDATFATDLLGGGRARAARATNVRGDDEARFGGALALDGDGATYWATDDEVRHASLEVELAAPEEMDVVTIEEPIFLGQRVKAFRMEALVDGAWREVGKGKTIGARRLLRFPPALVSALRLSVDDARGCPAVARLGAFRSPAPGRSGPSPSASAPTRGRASRLRPSEPHSARNRTSVRSSPCRGPRCGSGSGRT